MITSTLLLFALGGSPGLGLNTSPGPGLNYGPSLALGMPVLAVQDKTDQAEATPQAKPDERPAIFDRLPADLPRAELGTWTGLFPDVQVDWLLERVPAQYLAQLEEGRQLYLSRRYGPALEKLFGVLEARPDFPLAMQVLGTAYFRLRRYGDGAEAFERFLIHAPEQIWTTQALGHCYYSLGDYEAARAHYHRLLAAWPQGQAVSSEVHRALALCAWNTGKTEEALEQVNRSLELEAGNWESLCLRAQIYEDAEEDRLDEARGDLERARSLAPGEPRPLFLLFSVLYDLGEDDAAGELELAWQELDRLTQRARSIEGQLMYSAQPFGMAIELAEIQRQRRHKEGLRFALDMAVQTRPAEVSAVDLYSFALVAFGELGDREAGDGAAERMERECESEPEAWKALGDYYRVTQQTDKRLQAVERYLRMTERR